MRNPFCSAIGGVLSADIAVPDHAAELEFYASVLTTGESALWRSDLFNSDGKPIIGLGERVPEYANLPLQWMPHFQVNDVVASTKLAVGLGGKEIMRDERDDGTSQWAVLEDANGAAFGIIPVASSEGVEVGSPGRQGRIAWLSLFVPDAESSREYYEQVIGWGSRPSPARDAVESPPQFEMMIDHETVAACIHQQPLGTSEVPNVWLIHLPVGDLAESTRRAAEGGGKVFEELTEPGYVVVRDPVGVFFALQQG